MTTDDRAARLERQLAAAQQLTHIGSWDWNVATNAVTWSDELYRIYGLEPQSCVITFETFLARVHPEDRPRTVSEVQSALARGGRFAYPERIVRPDGSVRELDTVGEAAVDASGKVVGLIGTCRDVTEERRRERQAQAEQRVFEMVASGDSLPSILERIVLLIEAASPGTIASILLLDPDGRHIRHGAAPSLPDAYNRAIDGQPIGPRAGSCGTAAHRREPVYVVDIETDPLWEDYREIARTHGLRACWSTPILARDERVLGTFALYYREPRAPRDTDMRLIQRATHIAGVAIENRQLEAQLRALSEHVEKVREEERTAIAREIHDGIGQALTALKMDLARLAKRAGGGASIPSPEISSTLGEAMRATDQILDDARRVSAELRPGVLDDIGLPAAIEWQAQEFQRRTGIVCRLRSDVPEDLLDDQLGTAVFRIFQEALTNVARHAEAKSVEVSLVRDAGWIRLQVRDDGRGITADAVRNPRSLGLLGVRERAHRLGGVASIQRAANGGTEVTLRLPLVGRAA